MDILMGLVVAIFIITAAYVGYYASQSQPEGETHNITIDVQAITVYPDIDKTSHLPDLVPQHNYL